MTFSKFKLKLGIGQFILTIQEFKTMSRSLKNQKSLESESSPRTINNPKPERIKNKYVMKKLLISVDFLQNDLAALKVNRVKLYHFKKVIFKESPDHFGVHSLQLRIKPILKSKSYKIVLKRLFDVHWSRNFDQKAQNLMYMFRSVRNMHFSVDLYWNTCFERLRYFTKYIWPLRTNFNFTIKREPRQHCIQPFWSFFKSLRYIGLKSLNFRGNLFTGQSIKEIVRFRKLEKLVLIIGDRVQIDGKELLWSLSKLNNISTLTIGCNITSISKVSHLFKYPHSLKNLMWIYSGNNEYELIRWLAAGNTLETVLVEVSLRSWFNGIEQFLIPLPDIRAQKETRIELSCDIPCLENIGQERFFQRLFQLQNILQLSISFPETCVPLDCLSRHLNFLSRLQNLEVTFNFNYDSFEKFLTNTKDMNNLEKVAFLMYFEGPAKLRIPPAFREWFLNKNMLKEFKCERWTRYSVDVPELAFEDLENLFSPLGNLENLKHLCIRLSNLSVNNANKQTITTISSSLQNLRNLKALKLYFPDNYLKDAELDSILSILSDLPKFTSLKIEGDFSKVSRNGMKILLEFVAKKGQGLQNLKIRPKEYKGLYQKELAEAVYKAKTYRLLRFYQTKFLQYQQYQLV